jgi:hypothetical protein
VLAIIIDKERILKFQLEIPDCTGDVNCKEAKSFPRIGRKAQ